MKTRIGKVSATERCPSTCAEFTFWIEDDVEIKPFDIVKAQYELDGRKSTTFGIIKNIEHITDSPGHLANFVSSDFGDSGASYSTQRLRLTYAAADVLQNTAEIYMPVPDGCPVEFVDADEVRTALGLDAIRNPVPAGIFRMSNDIAVPIPFNRDFLLGPEGAHMNISGISGLATKTSYAMFLLQAIQQKVDDVAFVILNVKGSDLLRIDERSPQLESNKALREKTEKDWGTLGLQCKPFSNVKYFYPYRNDPDNGYAWTACDGPAVSHQAADERAFNYIYTFEHDRSKLDLLFSNIDDPNQTMESILNYVTDRADFDVSNWDELRQKLGEFTQKGQGSKSDIQVQSWRKFRRLVSKSVDHPIFQKARSGDQTRRQVHLSGEVKKIEAGDVFVVDIAKLDEQLQCFVFGDVIKAVYDLKLGETERKEDEIPGTIVIFVDELNKYASSSVPKNSPILNYLLEITERGRSMGIVLFSAEQFRSAIHDRVKGNCSTNVYGRTNAIEISKADYRYVPKVFASIMTHLKKGDLLIEHPVFRTMLQVSFPFSSYWQRKGDE